MKNENPEKKELLEQVNKRIFNDVFRFQVMAQLTDLECIENDFSALTAQEIIEKIRDHLSQKPNDCNSLIFLRYLASYPVSICKREISPLLKKLIGFHYNFGLPDEHEASEHGVDRVSYDELAEIFVRSKASISEYVNQFKPEWAEFQRELEKSKLIEQEARRQLIEEEKEKIKQLNGEQRNE